MIRIMVEPQAFRVDLGPLATVHFFNVVQVQNCNICELVAYSVIRSALKFEVKTNGQMVLNKNAKPSAIALLNAHRGTALKPKAKTAEVYALFCEHFGPYLPQG
jgi:hypothetical protein